MANKVKKPDNVIYLISDGTCRTCDMVVKAVLVQFEKADVHIVRKANVHRVRTVKSLVKEAAGNQALVFYTLISHKAREAMEAAAREYMVPIVDILGPVMVGLYDLFKSTPLSKPGFLYQSNKDHYDRIDAVEFTLRHDDGVHQEELGDADVVLVGVSRTSKSTTCFYLGYSGVRAANVPLFPDSEPSAVLGKLDPRRVIGLTANPHRLLSVREARARNEGIDISSPYVSLREIARELRAADEQMSKYGWRHIDVSYKAIEEIAREVMHHLEEAQVELHHAHLTR